MTDDSDAVATVRSYHDRTKHHLHKYAQALGYMDWAAQPNPFRSYDGAERIALLHPPLLAEPTYDELFDGTIRPADVSLEFVSRLFYDSLALSAWKQTQQSRAWSLRVNPSSGALQPTESYLIAGAGLGRPEAYPTGIFHYDVYRHCLEKRLLLTSDDWCALSASLPFPCMFVGLASIYWRESWKYGERAFRYCQHDVGHAIGCVAFAARLLGWRAHLLNSVADDDLAVLLGIHSQQGGEAEHPDCLLVICPKDADSDTLSSYRLPAKLIDRLRSARFAGKPNQLSKSHHDWPVIDEVARATYHPGLLARRASEGRSHGPSLARPTSAQQIIRQRRSAVDMDGSTHLTKDAFYHMMQRVRPTGLPFDVLSWQPRVSLALFVQRVTDLERGLYMLIRDPAHRPSLLTHLRSEFEWRKPADCPIGLEFYLLTAVDTGRAAKMVSCHQDIAADGAFSLGMLAEFDAGLADMGPSGYPRLFWETGLIGQVLYLEAEAAGIRATGIGCFFDDAMHDVLGIKDHSWQSLYHFTVGKGVEDARLKTMAPYQHLQ